MNMNAPPSLLRNDYRGANNWLGVRLEGTASNRSAIGATIVLTSNGVRQARAVLSQSSYYSHDDLRVHFGLGSARQADQLDISWPSGHTQTLKNVQARQVVHIKEGSSGSTGPIRLPEESHR
jgi:enediyne biosynthesis protein E4